MAYSKELEYYIQLLQGHRQNKGNIKIAIRCSGKNNFFSVYRPVDLSIEQTYTGRMRLEFKEGDGTMKDVFFDEVVNIMPDYWVGITEDNTYDMVIHKEDHPPQPKESFKNLTENDKAYLKEKGITMKKDFEDYIEKLNHHIEQGKTIFLEVIDIIDEESPRSVAGYKIKNKMGLTDFVGGGTALGFFTQVSGDALKPKDIVFKTVHSFNGKRWMICSDGAKNELRFNVVTEESIESEKETQDEAKEQEMTQPQYNGDARRFIRSLSVKQLTEIFEELMKRAVDIEPEEETDLQYLINEVDQVMDNVGDGLEPKMILQCKNQPMQTFQIRNIECVNTKHEQGATSLWLTTPDGGLHQWNLFNIRQTKASNFEAQTDDAEIHITFLSS